MDEVTSTSNEGSVDKRKNYINAKLNDKENNDSVQSKINKWAGDEFSVGAVILYVGEQIIKTNKDENAFSSDNSGITFVDFEQYFDGAVKSATTHNETEKSRAKREKEKAKAAAKKATQTDKSENSMESDINDIDI